MSKLPGPHTIWKEYRFEAAHFLPNVPKTHQCHNLHGHSYVVRVHVSGELEPTLGWVLDFGALSAIMKPLLEQVDHAHLNSVLPNPTAERLAVWFAERVAIALPPTIVLDMVEVQETPTSGARHWCW